MKDMQIEEVKADGGLDKWASEKEKRFESPGPKKLFAIQRDREVNWIKGPGGTMQEQHEQPEGQQQVNEPDQEQGAVRCECMCTDEGE